MYKPRRLGYIEKARLSEISPVLSCTHGSGPCYSSTDWGITLGVERVTSVVSVHKGRHILPVTY